MREETQAPSKAYDPSLVEDKWNRRWREEGAFQRRDPAREPYTIVIPPPNVTGSLHMGHALNLSVQDAYVRIHKMKGFDVLWIPGMDHAGIATQNVVEKQIRTEGRTRHDLGREAFIERTWEWKRTAEGMIRRQLERLGVGCDWTRERFTLDDQCARAVRTAFKRLYDEGLIYQDWRIINWCVRCCTALSDIEVDYEEIEGALYHFKYPLEGGGHVTVATTRPETMLGDAAVAVHPDDERHKAAHGKTVLLPLVGRRIPIILDEYVDMEMGTGALKVTPAHDPNDFALGKKHGLPEEIMLEYDGRIRGEYPAYAGMDRFEARKQIVADLEREGLFVKQDKHLHKVGHCQRCRSAVEPIVSLQWFVKTRPLAEPAVQAVREGRARFVPKRWENTFFSWMREIQDWCISRQLWWGHRIPVWKCGDCGKNTCEETEATHCAHCGSSRLKQDDDVLDTWFSSGLWPLSTLGWPDGGGELERRYPTSILVTGFDIIFFWVARMMMFGLKFGGDAPFRKVYIHGLIRDEKGRKMSKSHGNVIDPLQVMDKYGADALRFTLFTVGGAGQDIFLSEEKFLPGRNFCNKLYQAARFAVSRGEGIDAPEFAAIDPARFTLEDRWILTRLKRLIQQADRSLEEDNLNQTVLDLQRFIWDEVCDWHLETCKPRLSGADAEDAGVAKATLLETMNRAWRLLHPFMPFVTEEIWSLMGFGGGGLLVEAEWPRADDLPEDEEAVRTMETLQKAVGTIRDLRVRSAVPVKDRTTVYVREASDGLRAVLEGGEAFVQRFARVEKLDFDSPVKPEECFMAILDGAEFHILKSAGDVASELARLEKNLEKLNVEWERMSKKLENERFLANAPSDIINEARIRTAELESEKSRIREQINRLRAS